MRSLRADERSARREQFRQRCDQLVAKARHEIEGALTPRQLKALNDIEFAAGVDALTGSPAWDAIGQGQDQREALKRLRRDVAEEKHHIERLAGKRIIALLEPGQRQSLREELETRDWAWW